ncbi:MULTISPECIES: YhcN/YlaJ family sporulation lipoprotein [unclassified Bacillus (in: firmicutes)]|uniref:YhcN/YlaJ family sporulation lipoprotein n=1 Tax=unclassified Bacillus (in: firmicutes) TaxID=185979 RepID=UPI001BE80A38|nr:MULTISPECIES: YhcN/YlaJ family sporulation lipoprotein [unclassified Bacillus (in: firmicutes)]MBT2639603.1 YhcN/YlaJ family sporulation lipoprotein [Bacillus sp. ISL-39]MBT2661256.1 YhcN/YlaJ family sporulation lipoprotein [Bacillus sp. ISL-45]
MKRISVQLLILIMTVLLFTGCNTYTDEGAETYQINNGGAQIQKINQEYTSNSYNQTYRLHVEEDAEEQVEMLNEVQSATVITGQRKAYVAVVLENGDTKGIPADLENKISQQVKIADESITHVYVSSNADFVVSMTDYREQLQTGRPAVGLTEDFNATIERSFPGTR